MSQNYLTQNELEAGDFLEIENKNEDFIQI